MPQNKRFTKQELDFIRDNAKKLSVEDIAIELQRTPKGVRAKIERLGIKLSEYERNQPYKWTKEKVQYLKNNYREMSDAKVAERIGATEHIVLRKRMALGLNKQHGQPYIHAGYWCISDNGKKWVHKLEAEKKIGRKLKPHERVHHIDGDKLNNEHKNLHVCDKRTHGLAHDSLEKAALELYKLGYIGFDESTGDYFVKHDKLPTRTEG